VVRGGREREGTKNKEKTADKALFTSIAATAQRMTHRQSLLSSFPSIYYKHNSKRRSRRGQYIKVKLD
jgi:hemoglobin-like flavoprotein